MSGGGDGGRGIRRLALQEQFFFFRGLFPSIISLSQSNSPLRACTRQLPY